MACTFMALTKNIEGLNNFFVREASYMTNVCCTLQKTLYYYGIKLHTYSCIQMS